MAGLLGCWAAGLLGYWATGLLGCRLGPIHLAAAPLLLIDHSLPKKNASLDRGSWQGTSPRRGSMELTRPHRVPNLLQPFTGPPSDFEQRPRKIYVSADFVTCTN